MEGGDNLEVSVDLKKMNKKIYQVYWKEKCDEIVIGLCALLNSDGGKLLINIENHDVIHFQNTLDDLLRATEQRLRNFMQLWWLKKMVRMPQLQDKQLMYHVFTSNSVFTMKYHFYMPTLKQVEEIPPSEAPELVKDIALRTAPVQIPVLMVDEFVLGKSISLTESESIQFKQLKTARTKTVSIADRITNKKLAMTISAFANHCGGYLLYGMTNDGIAKGEILTAEDKKEIVKNVTKVIGGMVWLQRKMERGKHWNIEFVPVKDDHNNDVTSLFIVKISIQALSGGVFVEQPESYHIGWNSKVELMPFEVWRSRIVYGVKPVISPGILSCIKWSSTKSQRKYFKIIDELNELQNQANYDMFDTTAKSIKMKYVGTATELFVMARESAVARQRGMLKKAEEIVKRMEALLKSRGNIDDHKILEFRMLCAKSEIARAKGKYNLSYEIAKEAQQVAGLIPPGVLTAWFYNHVAIMEKFLSKQQQQQEVKCEMERSALNHYIKALQHVKASNVEQEFARLIADLEQKIHLFRAVNTLGDFATGASLSEVTASNIKAAETDLLRYKGLVVAGFLPTNYRQTYSLFAECDLRFAQWYQQHINQQEEQQQQERQQESLTCSVVYETPRLLENAYNLAIEARTLSKTSCFEELNNYASNRIGRITEIIVKLSFVSRLACKTS